MDEQMIDDMVNAMLKAQGFDLSPADIDPRLAKRWRKLARAAHSVIAGKVAELTEQRDALRSELEHERASRMHWQVRAALAPYPERRSE